MRKAAFTIKELTEQLGIGRSKIYRELQEGKLVAHKIGSKTVFLSQDVEQYLKSLPKA